MVIFVGDRPSKRTDPNVPFKGAACEARLMEWIVYVIPEDFTKVQVKILNSESFIDATKILMDVGLYNPKIIALGNKASERLNKMQVSHFKLPHPSGRNRQINDKAYIVNKLDECKKYLERS